MIAGWFDLSRGAPAHDAAAAAGVDRDARAGPRRFCLPGLDVAVGADGDGMLDLVKGVFVACEGRARFANERARQAAAEKGQAAGWIELLTQSGPRGLAAVKGDYAVAFLDLGGRSALLACDRFAVRPLCYAIANGQLRFGNRADAIPRDSDDLDLQSVYDYLYFHVIPTPRTIFRGVTRLPPAHVAEISKTSSRVVPHWSPAFEEGRTPAVAELKGELRALIRDAVAREATAGRVGCFLSGGTDSSTVSGMFKEVTGRPAETYSIGFDAAGYDETRYAQIAAQHFGTKHHEFYIKPRDLVESIPEVAGHYDQPFGNSSALPAYYCARIAKADGAEKLLAGDGGDELFGGNTRYALQRVFEAYRCVPQVIRESLIEPVLLGAPFLSRVPVLRKGARYVAQARVGMPDRLNTYNLLEQLGPETVLSPAFLDQVDRSQPTREQRTTFARTRASLINAMLAYDWKYTLADNDLPKVCHTAQLAGIRVGFPLLADEIVDFSLRLPPALKVKGLKLRYFFKEALRGFLPDEIIAKRKHGFGLPFGPWLQRDGALKALASDSVYGLADRGLVRRPFIDELMTRRISEVPGYYGEMVWTLMMLEQWLRRHAPRFRIEASTAH